MPEAPFHVVTVPHEAGSPTCRACPEGWPRPCGCGDAACLSHAELRDEWQAWQSDRCGDADPPESVWRRD